MDTIEFLAGIDWGSQAHQVGILDGNGDVLGERSFEHSGEGLARMVDWILKATGAGPQAIGIDRDRHRGAERPRGRNHDGAGLRAPLPETEAARQVPRPLLAGRRQGRPAGCPGACRCAAHRLSIPK